MTPLSVLVVFWMTVGMVQNNVDAEKPGAISDQSTPLGYGDGDHDGAVCNRLAPFFVRLHLVRHGETLANAQNIVLGQGDSPLTDEGLAVARLAANSNIINGKGLRYWRAYCSDLYRAHRTARIVLCLGDGDGNTVEPREVEPSGVDLIVDARLREIAKGAREGHLKSLSEEGAMAARRKGAESENNVAMRIPKLESIDEAWRRVQHWIDSIVKDAYEEYYSSNERREDWEDSSCNANESESERKIYDVFVLSHSALIRTMIHKMVGDELPANHAKTTEGSLSIPNLSRTVIDVHPYASQRAEHEGDAPAAKWIPSLFRLTDVSHLQAPSPYRPPYL